jgi:cytochrome c oxidase cbb3-type subunit 3
VRLRECLFAVFLLACSTVQAQTAKPLDQQAAMKACGGSITDDCVVRQFKDTMEASVIRGKLAYQAYCTLCHGAEGKGDGRAARLHTPRPFNLTQSGAPRDYINQILRKGGEAMGRGKGMPPWDDQLTDEQLNDTMNFLFSIRVSR